MMSDCPTNLKHILMLLQNVDSQRWYPLKNHPYLILLKWKILLTSCENTGIQWIMRFTNCLENTGIQWFMRFTNCLEYSFFSNWNSFRRNKTQVLILPNRYDSKGKGISMAPVGAGVSRSGGSRSMYSDRVFLSHITCDPTLSQDKVHIECLPRSECDCNFVIGSSWFLFVLQPIFFSTNALISHINPDQNMWYCACKTCNKKVTDAFGSGY